MVQDVDANELQSHLDNGDFLYTGTCTGSGKTLNDCQSAWCASKCSPFNGTWSYSNWGTCSGSCGGGIGTQTRTTLSCSASCGGTCGTPETSQACTNNSACPPVDVCPNIPGDQATVPGGDYINSDGNCVAKTPVCIDPLANNYHAVTPQTYADNNFCTYTDVCPNLEGNQLTVPVGDYINSDGNCVAKTPVCNDSRASNFQVLTSQTYADNELCNYNSQTYCSNNITIQVPNDQDPPEGANPGACPDVCPNLEGNQATVPNGYHLNNDGQCAADTTPTPNPDVCPNIPGIQYSFPFNMHLDAAGQNCVDLDQAGPPPNNGNGGGNNQQVLGASTTQGQVLGASTMAGTGSFAEELYLAIMGLGGIFSFAGIKKALKKA